MLRLITEAWKQEKYRRVPSDPPRCGNIKKEEEQV
jgi:hypothetical protein